MNDMQKLYNIRKKLHQSPEIAFQEFKTQQIIIDELKGYENLNLKQFTPTGLLYEYRGDGEDYFILFRADMDALPLNEETGCDFASQNTGTCHACGHDVHMTILIGLIKHCVENNVKQNILFLFQPAEEGYGGAKHIIDTGILNKYQIASAYALHVTSEYPTGAIGIKKGIFFGIPQEFDVEIFGKAGHVATPHKGKDAFLAAIQFVNEMNLLIAKQFPAQEPIIFHVGHINAGNVRNVIPDYCKMEGTTRCLKTSVSHDVNQLMKTVASTVSNSHGVRINVNLLTTYLPVINDEALTDKFLQNLPPDINVNFSEYTMTGEDFGYFTHLYSGLIFWLGTNATEGLHSGKFLPDEACIDVGLKIMISVIEGSK